MTSRYGTALDRALAKVCEYCPVCLHARRHQQGMAYSFVNRIEGDICPFCRAYERVHGKKAHEICVNTHERY
ncbi:MAG: hypothetical protein VB050_18215 [Geobacteraceae bacterium]|nr:hypothetical protein [Geobacteraceae bacterium]